MRFLALIQQTMLADRLNSSPEDGLDFIQKMKVTTNSSIHVQCWWKDWSREQKIVNYDVNIMLMYHYVLSISFRINQWQPVKRIYISILGSGVDSWPLKILDFKYTCFVIIHTNSKWSFTIPLYRGKDKISSYYECEVL